MKKNTFTKYDYSRPIMNTKGVKLNDLQTAELAIKSIEDYTNKYSKPAPIKQKFVEWLKAGVEHCKNTGESFAKYKERTIQRTINLDVYLENTNKQNAKLERKGAFKPRAL